ncbi:MAG: hypothetical protein HY059_03900, partial [Proteobacteria bacterium]|nr:hypothetical protein [Pseudomonadota bacterium]
LKTDGILRPGGPTIEHMRENFGALLDGHEPPTPDDIDAHHEVVSDDNPGTIAWRDPPATFDSVANLPEVDQETDASNARLARAMAKTGDFRGYAPLLAQTIKDSGLSGVAAVNDAIKKFDAINPGKGGLLASAVQSGVPKETLNELGLKPPEAPPKGTVQVAQAGDLLGAGILGMLGIGTAIGAKNAADGTRKALNPGEIPGAPPPLKPTADNENAPAPPWTPTGPDLPTHTGGTIESPKASDYIETYPISPEERKEKFAGDLAEELMPIFVETRSGISYGKDGEEKREDMRGGPRTIESNGIVAEALKEVIDESDCAELIAHDKGGSRNNKRIEYLKEAIIKAAGGDRRSDISASLNRGKTGIESRMHINTITEDALGNPIPREADAGAAIAEKEGADRFGMIRKMREGEDREAYKKEAKDLIREKLKPALADCRKFLDGFR